MQVEKLTSISQIYSDAIKLQCIPDRLEAHLKHLSLRAKFNMPHYKS